MAFDEHLAGRVRGYLEARTDLGERKMFGGLCFLVRGNMCCGLVGSDLMLRLGNDGAEAALSEPGVRPMDFTGRPLRSMVYVSANAIEDDGDLESWLDRALTFALSLPPK